MGTIRYSHYVSKEVKSFKLFPQQVRMHSGFGVVLLAIGHDGVQPPIFQLPELKI